MARPSAMPDLASRLDRFWPRRGIMATEAGRRVVSGVLLLTVVSFLIAALIFGLVALSLVALGRLDAVAALRVAFGMGWGLLALIGAFVLLPVMGRLSRLGDDVRFLELCDPGAPLLRELMDRAPGTYNHSIMAGALADAGARTVGANALLARVGAYYHDVGKLARPQFFAENQLGLRNPHDGAPPSQSAFIITAHVREGVAMAEAARLPRPVIDIIAEHHGTSLVAYFYRKATAGDIEVDEAPFRYEGRPPKSKEAALVMMADVADAAGRCLIDSGPAQIESAVRRVVAAKVADGQLADSGLTEAEVDAVVCVYAKMLAGLRHGRVEYPEEPPDE
jgi:hypothetical protein